VHFRRPLAALLCALSPAPLALLAPLALAGCASHYSRDQPVPAAPWPVKFDAPAVYPDIVWETSLVEARARAVDEHKPLLLFVRAAWSRPSVLVEATVFKDGRVLAEAQRFVAVRIDRTKDYGDPMPDALKELFVEKVPTTVVITSDGRVTGRFVEGKGSAAEVAEAMHEAK
jgi:thiol:disulfide interchange protein